MMVPQAIRVATATLFGETEMRFELTIRNPGRFVLGAWSPLHRQGRRDKLRAWQSSSPNFQVSEPMYTFDGGSVKGLIHSSCRYAGLIYNLRVEYEVRWLLEG